MEDPAQLKLEAAAARRHGVFTVAEAVALGVPARTVANRARDGRYLPVEPRVYAVVGAPATLRQRIARASALSFAPCSANFSP